ncbi:MAG: hypothetical protein DHS20C18_20320 [Saprospiraceae bacterium]|nr:MAG: hypothetical protein DHS20C18_20320 [Saprospiraceae bacterium]
MKKLLPLMVILFTYGFVSAQSDAARKAERAFTQKAKAKTGMTVSADIPSADPALQVINQDNPQNEGITYRTDDPFSIPLGSSFNVFSVLIEGQNPMTYNPESNSMVFCHRQNVGAAGGSGIISFDASTDGGVTWDTMNKQVTPSLMADDGTIINGNRYPNGSIYNPPGNTDPANARFVGVGAGLWNDPDFGSGWGYEFVASSKLDGSDPVEDYYSIYDTNAYIPTGLVYNNDGSMWYANYRREQSFPHQLFNPVVISKLEYNAGTDAFDHTYIDLPLNYENSIDSFAVSPRIEFAPDGLTGYAVIQGVDADDNAEFPSSKPIIWKTTDGGDNWVKQPRVQWQQMDSLIAYTIPVDADGDGAADTIGSGSPQIPYMSLYDITVDGSGQLHIFAQMLSSSNNATNADEFGFIWVGPFTDELFHFITDGEAWEHYRVAGYYNEDGDLGAAAASLDSRPQAGRTPDGQYTFFTYALTYYPNPDEADNINTNPDVWGYGYRLSDGYVANVKNFGWSPGTTFDDFEFTDIATVGYYHYLSPIVKDDGTNFNYELPIAYGIPTDVDSDLAPINYYYLSGAGFDESEFVERGTVVKTEDPFLVDNSLKVSPNPTSEQTFIDFNLLEATPLAIDLFDMMGRKVLSIDRANYSAGVHAKLVNLNGLATGTYVVRLQTASKIATTKLMVK